VETIRKNMENINFFYPETSWKKLVEKTPPKGGGLFLSLFFFHAVDFIRMEIIPRVQFYISRFVDRSVKA
jgi:hypothetical protein